MPVFPLNSSSWSFWKLYFGESDETFNDIFRPNTIRVYDLFTSSIRSFFSFLACIEHIKTRRRQSYKLVGSSFYNVVSGCSIRFWVKKKTQQKYKKWKHFDKDRYFYRLTRFKKLIYLYLYTPTDVVCSVKFRFFVFRFSFLLTVAM